MSDVFRTQTSLHSIYMVVCYYCDFWDITQVIIVCHVLPFYFGSYGCIHLAKD